MESENPQPTPPSWLRTVVIGRRPKRTFARIVVLVISCLIVFNFVLLPIIVQGGSMLPTYKENRVNLVNRLAYRWSKPKRGDVIAIRFAGPHMMLMKRIVGMPGETISFHMGHVLINGEPLDEPYVQLTCTWEVPPEKIGLDEYYVVGDNRSMPPNDHTKGRATRNRIIGKVML